MAIKFQWKLYMGICNQRTWRPVRACISNMISITRGRLIPWHGGEIEVHRDRGTGASLSIYTILYHSCCVILAADGLQTWGVQWKCVHVKRSTGEPLKWSAQLQPVGQFTPIEPGTRVGCISSSSDTVTGSGGTRCQRCLGTVLPAPKALADTGQSRQPTRSHHRAAVAAGHMHALILREIVVLLFYA
ncbi:hypothetical protein FA13DRAFT_1039341 [Coprinellus micaceus]|uniref:Uncharacterized protein n=1 Tax=Coprinellus micaceus TaxID=71717 RepID=A0A4Y7SXW6_COPMI|nr:hypothetical protein FA13DRAFT_1039341 [Coprinellus micaceus]